MIGLGEALRELSEWLPERVRVVTQDHERRIQVFADGKWEYVLYEYHGGGWGPYVGTDYYLSNAVREEYAAQEWPVPEHAYSNEAALALALALLGALRGQG